MVGHPTESVYRRYAIVDEQMLREGAQKLAEAADKLAQAEAAIRESVQVPVQVEAAAASQVGVK